MSDEATCRTYSDAALLGIILHLSTSPGAMYPRLIAARNEYSRRKALL